MREILKPALILFTVCVLTTLVLAGVKALTQGTIDQRQTQEAEQARKEALPEAASFREIDAATVKNLLAKTASNEYLSTIQGVFIGTKADGSFAGSVYRLKSRGYDASGVHLTVGIDPAGKIVAIKKGENLETPGLGTNVLEPAGPYMSQYTGKTPQSPLSLVKRAPVKPEEVEAVSGATITSRAVFRAVEGALQFSRLIGPTGEIQ